jgi:hypothetical protein
MKTTNAFDLQRSNLNEFVFSEVGIEANGMSLTLLSTLSRLGLDPWDEAERLADMPSGPAAERVAQCIASLPGSLWPPREAAIIAARLVQKLPKPGTATQSAQAPVSGFAAMFAAAPFGAARPAGLPGQMARPNPGVGGPPKGLRIALLIALLASAGLGMALNGKPAPSPVAPATVATTPVTAAPSAAAPAKPAVTVPTGK